MNKYIPSSVKGVLEMSRLHIDASGRVSPSGVGGAIVVFNQNVIPVKTEI